MRKNNYNFDDYAKMRLRQGIFGSSLGFLATLTFLAFPDWKARLIVSLVALMMAAVTVWQICFYYKQNKKAQEEYYKQKHDAYVRKHYKK